MQAQQIREALQSANNIRITKILKQHWRESSYSYLTTPRPDFGIMLLLRGKVNLISEHGTLTASEGNVVFLPEGCRYEAVFPNEADDYLVSFSMPGISLPSDRPMKIAEVASLSCVARFRELVEENYAANHTRLCSKGLFYLLLDAVVNDIRAEGKSSHRAVARACDLLRRDEEIPIADIAKECAVSESGLRKIFKEYTGTSPITYRQSFKLKQAKLLLDSTDMSVGEVAERLNFFDAAYFCRVFKNHVGMTPKQYAKSKKL